MALNDELESLLQQLKKNDPEWLHRTLLAKAHSPSHQHARYTADEHIGQAAQKLQTSIDDAQNTVHPAVWPFDRTTSLLDMQPHFVSDYLRFIHDFDWGSTELGPLADWDANMRRKVNMCLSDKQAGVLWIGPRFVSFYNEAYAAVAGPKHPGSLGRPAHESWGDFKKCADFEKMLREAYEDGTANSLEDVLTVIENNGVREETWCTFSITPIPDSSGGVFGSYNTVSDTTARIVSSRRHAMLLRIIRAASSADSPTRLWQQILHALDEEVTDVSFAALYAVDSLFDNSDDVSWRLQGTVGMPSTSLPPTLNAASAAVHISPAFDQAMAQRQPYLISTALGTFPPSIQQITKSRTQGDRCDSAVLFPIIPSESAGVLAFLMVGLNPLSRYNEDYKQLLSAVLHECTTSLATLYLRQEQLNFAERLARELEHRKRQSNEMETRFRRMSDMSPVAMFHLDSTGQVLYANKAWRELTGVPVTKGDKQSWLDFIYQDDRDMATEEFDKLTKGQSVSFEMRWKRSAAMRGKTDSAHDSAAISELWTIASAYPEFDRDGNIAAIYGCLTDITPQKYMQDFQERELNDARELKRQQENFMDMISHEMRNPMSAIVLTVESIAHELTGIPVEAETTITNAVNRMHESTEIIMTCVQHQKRIVDDVLTLSKFDSGLLDICPVPTHLEDLLSVTVSLFAAELKKHDISMQIVMDDTCQDLDCLSIDPSRLQQVIINLVTNAIKFTSSKAQRSISIVLSASEHRPTSSLHGCAYFKDDKYDSSTELNQVFLGVEVIDTGRGMTEEESAKLFHKFTQASAKTYAEYGGSGLGLFICRQLCKLQGGSIGVSSVLGKGTTFAFYIRALRCPAPCTGRKQVLAPVEKETLQVPIPAANTASSNTDRKAQVHILLVEDNIINQKVLCTTLERAKYNVHVANHGLEALEHIARSHYSVSNGLGLDVVLLDIEMPVCDGLECARRVREQQRLGTLTGHVPIIGVTANARAEQQQLAIEAGMDTVVTKPFKLDQLVEKLAGLGIRSS